MMRRNLYRWTAVALLLTLIPGAGELVENFGHMLIEGHLAHASETGDEHSEAGTEHGCTGTFHLCGCHASISFLQPSPLPGFFSPHNGHLALGSLPAPRSGFHQIPEQPPQA